MDKAIEVLREEALALRKRLAAVEGSIKLLGGSSTTPAKGGKRHLSAASRKALSNAAKKRWAVAKKAKA
jgi:hypothetical protein